MLADCLDDAFSLLAFNGRFGRMMMVTRIRMVVMTRLPALLKKMVDPVRLRTG
jgi:hypothetical protein